MPGDLVPVRWARVFLALIALSLIGEVICRIGIGAWAGRPFESLDAYTWSGYGVYRENPHYTHREFDNNQSGFRSSREFSLDKPPNTVRILAIGASVLYSGSAITPKGFSRRIRTNETITAYLEQALAGSPALKGRSLEVINTAVNRHNVRETLAYYGAELARYDPDIVLVFGTHNDSQWIDLAGGRERMFHQKGRPTPEEARVELLLNENSLSALMEKVVRVAANRSALAAVACRAVDRIIASAGSAAQLTVPLKPPPEQLASPEESEVALRTYLAFLGSLLTFIEQQGARPIVFWEYLLLDLEGIKPFTDYERDEAEFLKVFEPMSEARKMRRRTVRDRVAGYLAKREIPMIDIEGPVREYPGNLFNDYLHYDPDGNRWVGELLARRLESLLAGGASPSRDQASR